MHDFTGAVWSTSSTCFSELTFSLLIELQLLSSTLLLLWQLCTEVAFVVLSILQFMVLDAAEHSETVVDGISVGCRLGRESVAGTVDPIAGVTQSGVTQLSAGVLWVSLPHLSSVKSLELIPVQTQLEKKKKFLNRNFKKIKINYCFQGKKSSGYAYNNFDNYKNVYTQRYIYLPRYICLYSKIYIYILFIPKDIL